jgi:hypothetical protein
VATPVLGAGLVVRVVTQESTQQANPSAGSATLGALPAGQANHGASTADQGEGDSDDTTRDLAGTVSNAAGTHLEGITVSAYRTDGTVALTTSTDGSGAYSMSLAPGTYTVGYSDDSGAYGPGRWGNTGFTADSGTAGTITISSADVTGIDVLLPTARHITGTVSDPSSGGLANVEVDIYDASGIPCATATTAADGKFSIAVAPGQFEVGFTDGTGTRAGGYWAPTGLSQGFAASSRVDLSSVDQTQVDASMPNANVPGKPTGVVASRGSGSASVFWMAAPANGRAISGYAVTSSPGNLTCSTSGALTCTVLGLTNGTSYTFTVVATNAIGAGAASDPSNAVVPATVPGQPLTVTAVAGNTHATVSWQAPSTDGGDAITSYTVTSSPGAKKCTASGDLQCIVTGLTNGTAYTFTVTAANGIGVGAASAPSGSVTPGPSAPDQPTGVTASTTGLGAATVSWTAPDDNGSPITGYVVVALPGSATCSAGTALSCTVSGLNSGDYTFTVVASNALGASAASLPSNGVAVYTGATFHPIPLVRVVDSRIGKGTQQLLANQPFTLQFSGLYGIPIGATAITGTVAGIGGNYDGYILVGPAPVACGGYGSIDNLPTAADTRSNGFTVALNSAGQAGVVFCTSGTKQYVLDVSGYYTNDATGGTYHPMNPPVRTVDTRSDLGIRDSIPANTVKTFQVTGVSGVPLNATAVTGNAVDVNGPSGATITVGPSLTTSPGTSTINFRTGEVRAVGVTLGLSSMGTLSVVNSASSSVDFLFDITGYFTNDESGYGFHAISPVRMLDTRNGTGLSGKFYYKTPRALPVVNHSNIPADATGVTGNLTVVNNTGTWAVYAGPVSTSSPATSTINLGAASETRANGLSSGLGSGNLYLVYLANSGSTDLVFDATGYFR